jgi:hypothetical protein
MSQLQLGNGLLLVLSYHKRHARVTCCGFSIGGKPMLSKAFVLKISRC